MPKFKVHICRIAYQHLDIEVGAETPEEAMRTAEDEAGNHDFPTENSSEYEAQGVTEIDPCIECNCKYTNDGIHFHKYLCPAHRGYIDRQGV
jgi:hypothetical protein